MSGVRSSRLLLSILALAILLLVGFGTARHLTSQPEPTPTPTASPTPKPPTATPLPSPTPTSVPPTATPRPSPTVLPATPTPPPSQSVRTGGISYDLASLRELQASADRHEADYALDPVRVTVHDLPRFGFSGAPIEVVSPPPPNP